MDVELLIQQSQKDHRVDVIELAQRLGIKVYAQDLKDENGSIKYEKETEHFYIVVNSRHPVTRQRFTVAHEIGHFLKHVDKIKQKGHLDRGRNFKNKAEIACEKEADKQAAEILMPSFMVEEHLKTMQLTRKTKLNADMIGDIAQHFRVSRAMAVTRLRQLSFHIPYISFA